MSVVSVEKAKSHLSRLVEAVERGEETEIIITRDGRPAARLVAVAPHPTTRHIGVAKGRFVVPDSIDADEATIATMFSSTGS